MRYPLADFEFLSGIVLLKIYMDGKTVKSLDNVLLNSLSPKTIMYI